MERVYQELEQYLRLFVNKWQDDWDELLLMAEFQYNNHIHSVVYIEYMQLSLGWPNGR
jgi:hypothetical protein